MDEREQIERLSEEERAQVAAWAIKTSRTEEWTGAQVARLLALGPAAPGGAEALLAQAREEFHHAELYAGLARRFQPAAWCADYAARRANFREAGFTAIFRVLEATPVAEGVALVRYLTGLFFLDLAGLMAVDVYQASPFASLQEVARVVKADEGRHVHLGREFLRASAREPGGEARLAGAVAELLPAIDAFFGGDDSPGQRTLQRVGIRSVSNAELKAHFRAKAKAMLHV
jgi:1,2-phenylacetyl-CoA epoxidase catalytic subunit